MGSVKASTAPHPHLRVLTLIRLNPMIGLVGSLATLSWLERADEYT